MFQQGMLLMGGGEWGVCGVGVVCTKKRPEEGKRQEKLGERAPEGKVSDRLAGPFYR